MQQVCADASLAVGVLVDAEDYLKCFLAICHAEDSYMVTNLCAEARHPARLTSDVLRNICYHLDQLICAILLQNSSCVFSSDKRIIMLSKLSAL